MTHIDDGRPRFFIPNQQVYAVNAHYEPAIVPAHKGNPNIEALPPILEEDQWSKKLVRYPDFDTSLCSLPVSARFNLLEEIRRLYQPLETPLRLAMDFDTVIRSGYVRRNPFSPEYRRELLERRDRFDASVEKALMNEFDDDGVTTSGLTIKGLSGMGKTRSMNRILSWYPQVIKHTAYEGKVCLHHQIVYLKFDCPANGTLRAFAEDALLAIDDRLRTDYFHKYIGSRGANTNTLLHGFLCLATEHYLGALILDEIGNLVGAKEGRILQNLLILLSNDFHIPVILIGNPTAEHILATQFRQMRRSYGFDKYNNWLQMTRDGDDWDLFMEALWQYQYLKNTVPLTKALKNKLHKLSGGITDLAVKMFIAAQKRTMRDGDEKITSALLNFVAAEEFGWARGAVHALELGTPQALRNYEDLYSRNVKQPQKRSLSAPTEEIPQTKPPTDVATTENVTHPPDEIVQPDASTTPEPSKNQGKGKSKGKANSPGKGLLAQIVLDGRKNNKTAYQALKEAGWIGSYADYL